jgi:Leucine-rich repeat (LRR) protein
MIVTIDGQAFDGLESLGTLFLAKNHIVHMDRHAFANVQNLRWLNLDSNGLDDNDLLPKAFPRSLNTLFLAFNHLQVNVDS